MSTLTVQNLRGVAPTNSIAVPSGHTFYAPGHVVQVINFQTNVTTTSTSTIPWDNTIPQSNEGFEFLSASITPKSASSKLIIDICFNGYNTGEGSYGFTIALFQDTTSNALMSNAYNIANSANYTRFIRYFMAAGTTSTTTFKVRAGAASGTTGINQPSLYAVTEYSSITITEIGV